VQDWPALTGHLYRFIVRPIAVGGMLVGACYTLYRMRKNLIVGIKRGHRRPPQVGGRRDGDAAHRPGPAVQTVLVGIGVIFLLMIALYFTSLRR